MVLLGTITEKGVISIMHPRSRLLIHSFQRHREGGCVVRTGQKMPIKAQKWLDLGRRTEDRKPGFQSSESFTREEISCQVVIILR